MDAVVAQPRRWTRTEYEQMVDAGIFQPGEHVELLDGEILAMTPQRSAHTSVVHAVAAALGRAFGPGHFVRNQSPLALDPASEPEPDVAVVAGSLWDYAQAHPSTALLIVEVADTSLRLDRQQKGALYARAGIADYWIINLPDGLVEVYREPVQTSTGWGYRLVQSRRRSESIAPLARPEAEIAVADMLPPSQGQR